VVRTGVRIAASYAPQAAKATELRFASQRRYYGCHNLSSCPYDLELKREKQEIELLRFRFYKILDPHCETTQ
jgi:hypothetical protein